MAKEPHIYQKDGLGWYVESAGKLEGPLDSCQDAREYFQLMLLVSAARKECACLERECL